MDHDRFDGSLVRNGIYRNGNGVVRQIIGFENYMGGAGRSVRVTYHVLKGHHKGETSNCDIEIFRKGIVERLDETDDLSIVDKVELYALRDLRTAILDRAKALDDTTYKAAQENYLSALQRLESYHADHISILER